jgi:hypothetical protein
MKKLIQQSILFAALAWLYSCSPGFKAYTDYDRDFNIREFTFYMWAEDTEIEARNNPLYYNELNDKRIKNAVNRQLKNKGYHQTEKNPDLMIHYHIVVEDKTEFRSDPYGYYGPYWRRSYAYSYQYKQGTLIIDLMDAGNKHLLWRGWVTGVLGEVQDSAKAEYMIEEAVASIFEKLPPAIQTEKPITKK